MAKGKKNNSSKPKPLMKRLANDPTRTVKAEWKKLPLPAKAAVIFAGAGFTGIGAAQIAGWGRIGQAVAPIVAWGARQRQKLG